MRNLSLLIKPASSGCNMACKYCFYANVANIREVASFGVMKESTVDNLIAKSMENDTQFISYAFQGGEPTLAGLDFFKTFVNKVNQANTRNVQIHYALQTNGKVINDEWAEFFAKNHFLIGVSLDGYKEHHDSMRVDKFGKGTFDTVFNATKLLDKYNVEYNILTVVTSNTARHISKIYKFFVKSGFKYLQFIPCIDDFGSQPSKYSLGNTRYEYFLKTLFDLYYEDFMNDNYISVRNFDNWIGMLLGQPPENCAMSGRCGKYLVIESDGSAYPCDFYCLDKFKLGNINEDSFPSLLESQISHNFYEDSLLISQNCSKCKYYSLCRGGCKRDREPTLTENKYCSAIYNFFEYALPRMREIAQKIAQNYNNY